MEFILVFGIKRHQNFSLSAGRRHGQILNHVVLHIMLQLQKPQSLNFNKIQHRRQPDADALITLIWDFQTNLDKILCR